VETDLDRLFAGSTLNTSLQNVLALIDDAFARQHRPLWVLCPPKPIRGIVHRTQPHVPSRIHLHLRRAWRKPQLQGDCQRARSSRARLATPSV